MELILLRSLPLSPAMRVMLNSHYAGFQMKYLQGSPFLMEVRRVASCVGLHVCVCVCVCRHGKQACVRCLQCASALRVCVCVRVLR